MGETSLRVSTTWVQSRTSIRSSNPSGQLEFPNTNWLSTRDYSFENGARSIGSVESNRTEGKYHV